MNEIQFELYLNGKFNKIYPVSFDSKYIPGFLLFHQKVWTVISEFPWKELIEK